MKSKARKTKLINDYLVDMVIRNGDRSLSELDPRTAAGEFLALVNFLRVNRFPLKIQRHNIAEWIFGEGSDSAVKKIRALAGQLDERKLRGALALPKRYRDFQ